MLLPGLQVPGSTIVETRDHNGRTSVVMVRSETRESPLVVDLVVIKTDKSIKRCMCPEKQVEFPVVQNAEKS